MKKNPINPFLTAGYISPEYFCDRVEETERITNAIRSGRNLLLISLRRIGKTGLLKHVKYHLENNKNPHSVIYIDLLPTVSANDLLNALSTALIRIKREEKNFLEKVITVLGSLRPKLTIDTLTGQPSLELKVESGSDIQSGLDNLMKLITGIKKEIVIMFDEFQQTGNYPEKNTEHILRTIIQSYPGEKSLTGYTHCTFPPLYFQDTLLPHSGRKVLLVTKTCFRACVCYFLKR